MKVIFEHQSHPSGLGFLVKEYVQDYFTSPFHFHDLYELILIRKSYGKLYAGKRIMNFQDGDIFLFGPGFGHCFYNEQSFIDSGEKAHALVVFFREDFLGPGFFDNSGYIKVKELMEKSANGIQVRQTEELSVLFGRLVTQHGMDELITFLRMLHHISSMNTGNLAIMNESQSLMKLTNRDSERLEPVMKYVIGNFKEELDSKKAAELMHLNEASFCRYFKRRMEQTFSQFVNEVRITHATSLLVTEQWDILRICYECGYKNLSYFNRQFRQITGHSPKEYRLAFKGAEENLVMDSRED